MSLVKQSEDDSDSLYDEIQSGESSPKLKRRHFNSLADSSEFVNKSLSQIKNIMGSEIKGIK